MDKNAIKKYAVWARKELIARVSQKAQQYGITLEGYGDRNADSINGVLLSATEKKQRQALISKIDVEGFEQVMEEVAYTWFNRFTALRFMEVNNYLPSHTRVFTNEENEFKPQILADAISLELEGLDMDKVFELKDANKDEELYKYLLIVQCNALSSILPGMFQKIADYTELLLPDYLLREGSVIEQMVALIPEDDWTDQVQIIGWLYQYYNSEKKDEVFAALKKNVKITKENIPAATQLFTPDWIVRYMVENSLGRLWVEGHPNDELKAQWKYYLEEAEQEPEVQDELTKIRKEYAAMNPEEIKCIDPCCGSGHILAYMFDVLVQIYETYGYTSREAVASIVEHNIYGLDIDERAAQLANFAIMMKARQYDRRFFSRRIQPKVYAIAEGNGIDRFALDYFINGDAKLKEAIDSIVKEMHDAKEYGSILNITPVDFEALYVRFEEVKNDIHMSKDVVLEDILPLVQVAKILSQKYDVCITNPPYMGSGGMSSKLDKYVKENFTDSKSDMFAVFIEKCMQMIKRNGYQAMITQHSWMFLSSYERLRSQIVNSKCISSMLHLGTKAFDPGEVGTIVQTTSFVLQNTHLYYYKGQYRRLVDFGNSEEKEKAVINKTKDIEYATSAEQIAPVPNNIIAYWLPRTVVDAFKEKKIGDYSDTKKGILSGKNDIFVRYWFEPSIDKIGLECSSHDDMIASRKKWFPITSGGFRKKWYGNQDNVVNMENDGFAIKSYPNNNYRLRESSYYCREGYSWSEVAGNYFSVRYVPQGITFGNGGPMGFAANHLKYIIGFLNTVVANDFLMLLAPTLNFGPEQIRQIPLIIGNEGDINELVSENISIAKVDWDSFENSWEFKKHPLINRENYLSNAFKNWSLHCEKRFEKLKFNEIKLNQIFIDLYGFYELLPEIEDKDVTVRKADLTRDIKSFISYAVGCMFGRYSLDVEGLAYAGGEWDDSKYTTFAADKDNIIPICDDEYFEDDIVGRFIEFVRTVYGTETLEENLRFIADALGGKGQPKEVIRNYFLNDFYKDHCKIYQKRPIYWLFDSGKKNGFKALIYMHRYQPDTIARIRTDYVHEQQSRYRTAIEDLEQRILTATTSERVKLNKRLKTMKEQALETQGYEEKIHHLADQFIHIDLDDGVKVNYAKFQDVLAKIK